MNAQAIVSKWIHDPVDMMRREQKRREMIARAQARRAADPRRALAGVLGLAAAVETVLPGASLAEVERQLAALGKPRKTTRRGTTRRVTSRTAQVRAQARALAELVSRANEPAEEAIDA